MMVASIIVVSNNVTLSEGETDYIITNGYLTNAASNTFMSNTNTFGYNLTLIEGNNIVSNTYLQSVLSTLTISISDIDDGGF
jgi:hypothetical protein